MLILLLTMIYLWLSIDGDQFVGGAVINCNGVVVLRWVRSCCGNIQIENNLTKIEHGKSKQMLVPIRVTHTILTFGLTWST